MNLSLYYDIVNKLKYIIDQKNKHTTHSILISISAGQDSLCLIKMIENINKIFKSSLNIQYIYIDHQWKANSKYQIRHIVNYLKSYNNSIYIYQIKTQCLSETEARIKRYQILFSHAHNHNINIILTGHNLTDKIETFLQNLCKGTSLDGATSLTECRYSINNYILFRPLLNISRNETQWLCRNLALPIWSDQTNYYYYIARNRIRHELLPYLKNYISNNIEYHLASFLRISNIDNEYLKQNTIKCFLLVHHKKRIALNYKIIQIQHSSIRNRILQLFSFHYFNKTFNQQMIEKIIFTFNTINKNQSKYLYIKWEVNKNIYVNNKWLYIN